MGTYHGRLGGGSGGSDSGGGNSGRGSKNPWSRTSRIEKIEERVDKGQNITQEEYNDLQDYKDALK